MSDAITALAPTELALNAQSLCDRCGVQAWVQVVIGRSELLFCVHHSKQHAEKMQHQQGIHVLDYWGHLQDPSYLFDPKTNFQ